MKVLLTGASGFLGRHLLSVLVEQGYRVRAMARKVPMDGLGGPKAVQWFAGDLRRESDRGKAVEGCGYVIHAAADTSQGGMRLRDRLAANSEASLALYLEACKAGCQRFVFVSTSNTIGFGGPQNPGMEDHPPSACFAASEYAMSKHLAEKALLEDSDNQPTSLVILNPCFMIGPGGQGKGSMRIVEMAKKRWLSFYPPGGKNFCDVRDVARATVIALHTGQHKERYLLTGETLPYREFFGKVASASGNNPLFVRIPPGLLSVLGRMGAALQKLGFDTELNSCNAAILCETPYYGGEKAARDLSYFSRPVNESLRDALDDSLRIG